MNLKTPPITPTKFTHTAEFDPDELIVVCVYWGDKYDVEYVHRLQRMVGRNLTIPHRFVCLTDRFIEGINCIPITQDWSTWWQKVSLFQPGVFLSDATMLYFDLDVVIINNIDHLAKQVTDDPITMIYNFGPNRVHCAHNSSVMMWTADDPRVTPIFEEFHTDVMKILHGDQCWIWRVMQDNISNWPLEHILSYKYDCRNRNVKPSADVIVFHGDPKPHQCNESWVKDNWK